MKLDVTSGNVIFCYKETAGCFYEVALMSAATGKLVPQNAWSPNMFSHGLCHIYVQQLSTSQHQIYLCSVDWSYTKSLHVAAVGTIQLKRAIACVELHLETWVFYLPEWKAECKMNSSSANPHENIVTIVWSQPNQNANANCKFSITYSLLPQSQYEKKQEKKLLLPCHGPAHKKHYTSYGLCPYRHQPTINGPLP